MRNALCVCTRNQTDRTVWERGCQISRHLIISHLVSGSIKELSDRACKIATITSLCADPIHSPLNTEVWQWLSVVADVSASVDSSDRRRLWRIRLAQQVACQSRPCHHFSPRTSESSTLTCRVSTCITELGGKGNGLSAHCTPCEEVHPNASFQFYFCSTSGTKWNCNCICLSSPTGLDMTALANSVRLARLFVWKVNWVLMLFGAQCRDQYVGFLTVHCWEGLITDLAKSTSGHVKKHRLDVLNNHLSIISQWRLRTFFFFFFFKLHLEAPI